MTEAPKDNLIETTDDGIPLVANGRRLSEVEIQCLREAEARRREIDRANSEPDLADRDRSTSPTRYGDWEKAGRAIDFS